MAFVMEFTVRYDIFWTVCILWDYNTLCGMEPKSDFSDALVSVTAIFL